MDEELGEPPVFALMTVGVCFLLFSCHALIRLAERPIRVISQGSASQIEIHCERVSGPLNVVAINASSLHFFSAFSACYFCHVFIIFLL